MSTYMTASTAHWRDIQGLVPQVGQSPGYLACLEVFPQLELAKTTPQEFAFHHYPPQNTTTGLQCE